MIPTDRRPPPPPPPPAHDARGVANYFLKRASAEDKPIDQLKIQKLVYIAHGWHLAICGSDLIRQKVYAWTYGPVIPDIYKSFNHFGRRPIDVLASCYDPDTGGFTPYEIHPSPRTRAILDKVWESYKRLSGLRLSAMTHDKGTPWYETVGHLPPSDRRDEPISNELIQRHYLELARRGSSSRGVARSES